MFPEVSKQDAAYISREAKIDWHAKNKSNLYTVRISIVNVEVVMSIFKFND